MNGIKYFMQPRAFVFISICDVLFRLRKTGMSNKFLYKIISDKFIVNQVEPRLAYLQSLPTKTKKIEQQRPAN